MYGVLVMKALDFSNRDESGKYFDRGYLFSFNWYPASFWSPYYWGFQMTFFNSIRLAYRHRNWTPAKKKEFGANIVDVFAKDENGFRKTWLW